MDRLHILDINKRRVLYFDVLNVLSCFSVVCLHSNGYVHEYIKDDYWWLRVFIEVICFFAVPVFFMLSGATLMDYRKKYSTKEFVKKRIQKAFFPFLFWSVIFLLFHSMLLIRSGNDVLSWKDIIESFVTGTIPYANYWFFIPLFLLYAFLPFLSYIVEGRREKQVKLLCIVLFLFQFLIPSLYKLIGVNAQYDLPIGGFFVYALMGYHLSKSTYEKNNTTLVLVCLLAVLFLIIRYSVIYFSEEKNPWAFSYFGMYALFPSITVFLLVKKLFPGNDSYVYNRDYEGINKCWSFLAKKSYGVFLIHTFLISNLMRLIELKSVHFIPFSIMVAYFGSVLIVHFMQKNALMRHTVP